MLYMLSFLNILIYVTFYINFFCFTHNTYIKRMVHENAGWNESLLHNVRTVILVKEATIYVQGEVVVKQNRILFILTLGIRTRW